MFVITVGVIAVAGDESAEAEAASLLHRCAVGADVKDLRSRLGMTQEQLAHYLDVSFVTVNRWETGRRLPSSTSQRRLDELARSAQVPTSQAPVATASAIVLPSTPFIGRDKEFVELCDLFEDARLITLIGPGGSGKTRLAAELARRCGRPDETVAMVGLDVINDATLVPTAIGAALGVRSTGTTSADDLVIAHLASRPCLLVLDNCEHVAAVVRQFVETALGAAPQLRVLVTSRIVLDVAGEQVWPVPALQMAATGSGADAVARSDAGRLFVERARRAQPGFVLDDPAATSIVRICELLDGLPLALELAAAWLSTLSIADVAARLDGSIALLNADGGGGRRHRTLRSVAEWSDALLDPPDRAVLAALSVFAGLFTVADAERVAERVGGSSGSSGSSDIVHALRRLVTSSWVVAVPGNDSVYGMLNTLRSYARELLQRSGEETIVRDRHAQAFADIAEASEMGLSGDEQAEWQRRMDRANGDFVVALERSRANRDDDTSLRLVGSLWRWWYTSGRITEGRAWAATALAGSRSASPSRRAKALYTSAILAAENGDYGTAWAHAQSARRSFEAVGDHVGMSRSSTILGNVAKFRGDAAAAVNHLTDAVAGQRMVGDDKATAVALQNLAAFVIDQGGLGHGRALMEDSLALKRRAGDRRSLGYGLINLSDLLVREGSPDEARTALNEAGEIAQTLSDDRLGSFVEHNLGDVAVAAGEDDTAMVHYDLALAGFRRVGDRRDVALALCSLGLALTRAGRRDEGVQRLRESEALAAEIGDEVRLSEARSALTIAEVPSAAGTLPGGLTVRQAEILTLLTTGSSNRDIAQRLALSAGTVERHLANIYQKLGVSNRVRATRYALAHGLGAADVSTERPR